MRARRVGARRVGAPTQKKWGAEGWGPEGWGPEGWEKWARRVGARRVGAQTQKKWGSEGWGPEGWRAQNFALFFPLPPRSFCVSLGVFSLNFGGVFEGFTRQPESPNVHILSEGLGLQNTTKIHREPWHNSTKRRPEREERTNFVAGEGKRRAKF